MKQKRHSTEAIIRILRQSKAMKRLSRSAANTTSPKQRSIVGSANTATWIWPMLNGLKS